jgi:hypothetical protein
VEIAMNLFLQRLRPAGQGRHRATSVQIRAARSGMNGGGTFAYVKGAYVYVPDRHGKDAADGRQERS